MSTLYSFCKRPYFRFETYACTDVFDFCTRLEELSKKVERIKNALIEKHDSSKYAISLYDSIHPDMIKLIETEPYKKSKVDTLKHITNDEYAKQISVLAPKYVAAELYQEFAKNKTIRGSIDFIYNYTELNVFNKLSLKRLGEINTSLIDELESLKQYKEIERAVNVLQYLMSNVYKMRNKFASYLTEDSKYLVSKGRTAKCIVYKSFRQAVHEIKQNIYSSTDLNH